MICLDEEHYSYLDGIPYAESLDRQWGAGAYVRYIIVMEQSDEDDLGSMECYGCGGFNGRDFVIRKVVKLGPVVNERVDPTQSYVLECGHTMI